MLRLRLHQPLDGYALGGIRRAGYGRVLVLSDDFQPVRIRPFVGKLTRCSMLASFCEWEE